MKASIEQGPQSDAGCAARRSVPLGRPASGIACGEPGWHAAGSVVWAASLPVQLHLPAFIRTFPLARLYGGRLGFAPVHARRSPVDCSPSDAATVFPIFA